MAGLGVSRREARLWQPGNEPPRRHGCRRTVAGHFSGNSHYESRCCEGLPIWSEVEVACRVTDADIIGITGTNGKTTTTTLVGEIMKATGRQTVVGGNIGYGLSEQAKDLPKAAVVVAELSSFQLEFTRTMKAKAAVILNITPDHLNRHKTMENYALVKESVTKNQTARDVCVLNYEDERLREFGRQAAPRVLFFSSKQELSEGAYLAGDEIFFALDGKKTPVMQDPGFKLARSA